MRNYFIWWLVARDAHGLPPRGGIDDGFEHGDGVEDFAVVDRVGRATPDRVGERLQLGEQPVEGAVFDDLWRQRGVAPARRAVRGRGEVEVEVRRAQFGAALGAEDREPVADRRHQRAWC